MRARSECIQCVPHWFHITLAYKYTMYHSKCLKVYYTNNITLTKQIQNFILNNSINSVKQYPFHKIVLIGICYSRLINSYYYSYMSNMLLLCQELMVGWQTCNYLNQPVVFFKVLAVLWIYSSSLGYSLPSWNQSVLIVVERYFSFSQL